MASLAYTKEILYFPPTKNSNGKTNSDHDTKEIICFDQNIFNDNVIFMSDMHSHTKAVIDYLVCSDIDLSKFVIVTLGDMWGNGFFGSDGDPTPFYHILKQYAKALYIIQGNHDLPPSRLSDLLEMKNRNGTKCLLTNGHPINTSIGKIGGIHGTISAKIHPYKMPEKAYLKLLKSFSDKGLDILLTHDTPRITDEKNNILIGNIDIYNTVTQVKPKVHVYGHCYHPPVNVCKDIIFLNADSKVLIFETK
jgi:predicted phosphodiesterase